MNAPVLIVVHDGPGGNHLNQLPLQKLATDFRIIFYDQRGTGKSERLNVSAKDPNSLELLSLEKNIEDIEELRKSAGRDKISVIGHSNGGALAVFYAAKYPQHVEKLIVYSGGPEDLELAEQKRKTHVSKMSEAEKSVFKQAVSILQERSQQDAHQEELDELFARVVSLMIPTLYCHPPKGPIEVGRLGFWSNVAVSRYIDTFNRKSFAPSLQQIKAPTLLIWGRCEPAPNERLVYLLDHIPNSQFVIFEHSGHNAMEEESELFFNTLREFMSNRPIEMKVYRNRKEI